MKSYSRRDFTRHAGLAALFSPFLSLLESQPARAAAGKAKYLYVFFTNGTDNAAWSPKGSSASSITFSKMTEPLSAIKDNVILIEKLSSNGTAGSHGAPGGLTGHNYGGQNMISLEQFVGDQLKAAGIKTQIPSSIMGGVPSEQLCTFYRDSRALSPLATPTSAYQAIFGGALPAPKPTTGGTPAPDPALDDRLRRRKSVLDLMHRELDQLGKTLGSFERAKLEVHADSIRQLEERLAQQSMPGSSGGGVMPGNCETPGSPANGSEALTNAAACQELAINAFACDITRVAAVQYGHHQNCQVSLPEVGEPGDWHNIFLHSDNPRTRLVNLERWLCKQFVAAVDKLKSLPAPDGDGTLYDQTLLVWARDMGDSVQHEGNDLRYVFSGGAGGYLKYSPNGRYFDGKGQAHMSALLNCVEGMGFTNFSGFGPAQSSRTPLSELTT